MKITCGRIKKEENAIIKKVIMDPVSNKIIIFFNFLNINFLPILATFNNSVIPVIFPPALKMLHDKIIDLCIYFANFF